MKKKNAFTLVELVAVLVIMAIIALIATPLILTLVNNAKASANKRSVDAYGKAVELAAMTYLMDNGVYPSNLTTLEVEYTGSDVTCGVMTLNNDGSLYLSECSVSGKEVKDKNTDDGFYHYGKKKESSNSNTAVAGLLAKANDVSVTTYEAGTDASHEMYTFTHEATVQTEALTDYRYIGNDPYNYVTFNDETWRIIGVFTVEGVNGNKEQRIKIIKDESIGEYHWNSNDVNEWETATLNTYLNGEYYNLLSNSAQSMIVPAKYYLGGNDTSRGLSANDCYYFERGNTVYSGRSINWMGNIGLIYPSDYAYTYSNGVDEKCFTDTFNCEFSTPTSGWLYYSDSQWSISSLSDDDLCIYSLGYSEGCDDAGTRLDTRPTLYLSSSVKIVDGDGSQGNPYQLSL